MRSPVQATDGVAFGTVASPLALADAKERTDDVRAAIGAVPGAEVFVSGTPAIQADLDPIFADDLLKGEAIALPVALVVLLAVFGLSFAVLVPFVLAACTIAGTLGLVWGFAHLMTTATYVTNLVQLIGLAIAIDYSLLMVYRFREELARGAVDEAVVQTMATAGRPSCSRERRSPSAFALLLFMPLPFMRSMGLGGFLIPLPVAAALTLQRPCSRYSGAAARGVWPSPRSSGGDWGSRLPRLRAATDRAEWRGWRGRSCGARRLSPA